MTTNKPGSVNQRPLYGCTSCYEECTWPASGLRVHDAECWCDLCWDEYKVAETGIGYFDLPAFEPYMSGPDVAVMVKALERIANMGSMSYHSLDSAKITARNALDVLAAHRKQVGEV